MFVAATKNPFLVKIEFSMVVFWIKQDNAFLNVSAFVTQDESVSPWMLMNTLCGLNRKFVEISLFATTLLKKTNKKCSKEEG